MTFLVRYFSKGVVPLQVSRPLKQWCNSQDLFFRGEGEEGGGYHEQKIFLKELEAYGYDNIYKEQT